MANKHDVLRLLEQGLSPQQVAERLGCSDAYVRATRQRATPEGREKNAAWARQRAQRPDVRAARSAYAIARYREDAEYRARHNRASAKYYASRKMRRVPEGVSP